MVYGRAKLVNINKMSERSHPPGKRRRSCSCWVPSRALPTGKFVDRLMRGSFDGSLFFHFDLIGSPIIGSPIDSILGGPAGHDRVCRPKPSDTFETVLAQESYFSRCMPLHCNVGKKKLCRHPSHRRLDVDAKGHAV